MNIFHDLDTLLSIAEIAGVFVGFAALVSVIPRRAEASDWFVGSFNLVVLVLTSIVVIVGALVCPMPHRCRQFLSSGDGFHSSWAPSRRAAGVRPRVR
jgi:hypothetical protein